MSLARGYHNLPELTAERFIEIPALHQSGLYRAEALRSVPYRADLPDILNFFQQFDIQPQQM